MSKFSAVVIGGSAGSFEVMLHILPKIRPDFPLPIIVCLHRPKQSGSNFASVLAEKSALPVIEPYDKDHIMPGKVYVAPANYHLFVEPDFTFSLSVEECCNYCRPAIDYTLASAAKSYSSLCLGIILTGANHDGAEGLKAIADYGGFTIVQDPESASVRVMPESALRLLKPDKVLNPDQIIDFLNSIV